MTERIPHPITGEMVTIRRDLPTPESFWTYKASSPTPSLADAIACRAIKADTTQGDWDKLSPGFKREIVRSQMKRIEAGKA